MQTLSGCGRILLRVGGWTCVGVAAGAFYFFLQTWLEGEALRDNVVLLPAVLTLGLMVGVPSGFFFGLVQSAEPREPKMPTKS